MDNNNRTYSDAECGSEASSISFILAEEIDSLQPRQEDIDVDDEGGLKEDSPQVGVDSLAALTKSQYAQVKKEIALRFQLLDVRFQFVDE